MKTMVLLLQNATRVTANISCICTLNTFNGTDLYKSNASPRVGESVGARVVVDLNGADAMRHCDGVRSGGRGEEAGRVT